MNGFDAFVQWGVSAVCTALVVVGIVCLIIGYCLGWRDAAKANGPS